MMEAMLAYIINPNFQACLNNAYSHPAACHSLMLPTVSLTFQRLIFYLPAPDLFTAQQENFSCDSCRAFV